VKKVRERREDFQQRGRIYRGAFVVAGFVLVLGGIAMLVLPGPAFVVIPIGLAILSLQFAWAESLLDRSLVEADKAKVKAQRHHAPASGSSRESPSRAAPRPSSRSRSSTTSRWSPTSDECGRRLARRRHAVVSPSREPCGAP
jgi:uncharacterized protein (TIGR02611 family)